MSKKPTKAEMEQRVTQVYRMMLAGATRGDVLAYTAKHYEISTRQTDTLIQRAREQIAVQAKVVRDYEFALVLARNNELYKDSYRLRDLRECRQLIDQRAKLIGLYPVEKFQVDWRIEVVQLVEQGKVTPEQVRAEFGDDIYSELFERTGQTVVLAGEDRPAEGDSE